MPTDSPKKPISQATGEFGRRVRQRRQELGLSQEKLAERSDLHWSYIGQVERGQTNLSLHNIILIADTLGVDASELVSGIDAAAARART